MPPDSVGRMGKHPLGLRLIIIERAIAGGLIILVSLSLFSLMTRDLEQVVRSLAQTMNLDADSRLLNALVAGSGMVTPSALLQASIGGLALGAIDLAQAYGLYHRRKWAEYLTAIAIAAFIPIEVYSLFHQITVPRVLILLVNAGIVVYLLIHKELFGNARIASKVVETASK